MDSNLLVYFFEAHDQVRHQKMKEFMREMASKSSRLVVSNQNLREFSSICLSKKEVPPLDVMERIKLIQRMFGAVLVEHPSDVQEAILTVYSCGAPFFDALLAATARRNNVATIYTEDLHGFERISGIKAVNPLM